MPWYHPPNPFDLYVSRRIPIAEVCRICLFPPTSVASNGVWAVASWAFASRSFSETKWDPDSWAGSLEATTLAYEVGAVGSVVFADEEAVDVVCSRVAVPVDGLA
jgi:hypothetical protein